MNHSNIDTGITWSRINYRNELYKLWEDGRPGQDVLTHGQGVTQTRAYCAKSQRNPQNERERKTMLELAKKENEKKVRNIIALLDQVQQLAERITKGENEGNILSKNAVYLCEDIRMRLNQSAKGLPTF